MATENGFSISKDNIACSAPKLQMLVDEVFDFPSTKVFSPDELGQEIQKLINTVVQENHVTGEIQFKMNFGVPISFVLIPISHDIYIPINFLDSFYNRKQNPLRLLPDISNKNIDYMVRLGAKQLAGIFIMNCSMLELGRALPAIYEGFQKNKHKEIADSSIGLCCIGNISSKSILTKTISNATKSVRKFSIVPSLDAIESELARKLGNLL